jgi:hypothetical protein
LASFFFFGGWGGPPPPPPKQPVLQWSETWNQFQGRRKARLSMNLLRFLNNY